MSIQVLIVNNKPVSNYAFIKGDTGLTGLTGNTGAAGPQGDPAIETVVAHEATFAHANIHSHLNKAILDGIDATDLVPDHVSMFDHGELHTHANQALLDAYTGPLVLGRPLLTQLNHTEWVLVDVPADPDWPVDLLSLAVTADALTQGFVELGGVFAPYDTDPPSGLPVWAQNADLLQDGAVIWSGNVTAIPARIWVSLTAGTHMFVFRHHQIRTYSGSATLTADKYYIFFMPAD